MLSEKLSRKSPKSVRMGSWGCFCFEILKQSRQILKNEKNVHRRKKCKYNELRKETENITEREKTGRFITRRGSQIKGNTKMR